MLKIQQMKRIWNLDKLAFFSINLILEIFYMTPNRPLMFGMIIWPPNILCNIKSIVLILQTSHSHINPFSSWPYYIPIPIIS